MTSYDALSDFTFHYKKWKEQTMFESTNIYDNEHFKAIVDMGEKAVAFILAKIEQEPNPIIHALDLIYPDAIKYEGFTTLETACKLWRNILKTKESNNVYESK